MIALNYEINLRDAKMQRLSLDRVDNLTIALQEITQRYTKKIPTFSVFKVSEQIARQSVLDYIGDLDRWKLSGSEQEFLDTNFIKGSNRELVSDQIQNMLSKPLDC